MGELEQEILNLAKVYFDKMDEEIGDEFLLLMIRSVVDGYKNIRNYPLEYTDEMIEDDCVRYFSRRKSNIAMQVLPDLYGRIGAEGVSMLTDAGTTRFWVKEILLGDVVPICEVV